MDIIRHEIKDNAIYEFGVENVLFGGNKESSDSINFDDIINMDITLDKETNRAFVFSVLSPDKEFVINSDEENSIKPFDAYNTISPFLLGRGFTEKKETTDDGFIIISLNNIDE